MLLFGLLIVSYYGSELRALRCENCLRRWHTHRGRLIPVWSSIGIISLRCNSGMISWRLTSPCKFTSQIVEVLRSRSLLILLCFWLHLVLLLNISCYGLLFTRNLLFKDCDRIVKSITITSVLWRSMTLNCALSWFTTLWRWFQLLLDHLLLFSSRLMHTILLVKPSCLIRLWFLLTRLLLFWITAKLVETSLHFKLLCLLFLLSGLITGIVEPLSILLSTLGRLNQIVLVFWAS